MFAKRDIVRILINVDRQLAIGSIIEAEGLLGIRQESEIQSLINETLDVFRAVLPDFVISGIGEFYPEIWNDIGIFLVAIFGKYLGLIPGEEMEISLPEITSGFEKPVDYAYLYSQAVEDIENLNLEIVELEKEISRLRDLLKETTGDSVSMGLLKDSLKRISEILDEYAEGKRKYSANKDLQRAFITGGRFFLTFMVETLNIEV